MRHLYLPHEGLKAAIVCVLGATWQRCRVHWTRNALAYVPKGQHTMVAAALRQAFQQPDAAARTALLHVAEMMRARWPKPSTTSLRSKICRRPLELAESRGTARASAHPKPSTPYRVRFAHAATYFVTWSRPANASF